jgi:putative PIN family toxin of toxin-antitoxin system
VTSPPPSATLARGAAVVIDTNIVLDLLVFADAQAQPLQEALARAELQWLATADMRAELLRVLDYPQIVPRLAFHGLTAADVMARFDAQARLVDVAPKASVTCKDADDQKFIDLAVAHRALLLSKDRAVLSMQKRLAALGAPTSSTFATFAALRA